jgi:hypothetical protein
LVPEDWLETPPPNFVAEHDRNVESKTNSVPVPLWWIAPPYSAEPRSMKHQRSSRQPLLDFVVRAYADATVHLVRLLLGDCVRVRVTGSVVRSGDVDLVGEAGGDREIGGVCAGVEVGHSEVAKCVKSHETVAVSVEQASWLEMTPETGQGLSRTQFVMTKPFDTEGEVIA